MASNRIQMLGINSGMDTESIVNALLQPYQNKIDVQNQKQTKLEWKQDAWKDLNTKVSSFFNNYVSKLKMSTTFKGNKVTNTNESAIKIDTSASTIPTGVHKFAVSQLASTGYMRNSAMTAGSIQANKVISNANADAGNLNLKDLGINEPTTFTVKRYDEEGNEITAETKTITVNPETDSYADFKSKLEANGIKLTIDDEKGSFSLGYDGAEIPEKEKVTFSVESGSTGCLTKMGLSSATFTNTTKNVTGSGLNEFSKSTTLGRLGLSSGTITLNGKNIDVKEGMTLSELETELKNADSNLNVNLDLGQKRFYISTKDTGADKKIEISASSNDLLAQLGLKHEIDRTNIDSETPSGDVTIIKYKDGTEVSVNNATGAVTIKGADAKYTYNGMEYTSSSNNISVNNIKATLLEATPAGQTINITSSNDPTEVTKFVKEFVDEYNKLIEEINTLITTKPSKKYTPLTDAQRDEMSEEQIEKWEKLAKQGLFYQDSDLISIRDTMRNLLSSVVSGTEAKTLHSIGITTGSWSENGKLHFDEDKFAKAYTENPDDVIKLLTGSGNEKDAIEAYKKNNPGLSDQEAETRYSALTTEQKNQYYNNTKGIASRLYDSMNKLIYSSSLNKTYGNIYNDKTITKEIKSIEDRIDELQDRFDRMETLYYKKFTAMEKALSSMNTQQNWLASALG